MQINDRIDVPIAKTNLTDNEINSVLEPLRSGWLVQGSQVKSFEKSGVILPDYRIPRGLHVPQDYTYLVASI